MKIADDKYYTPVSLANECWEIVDRTIDVDVNVKRIIEPSVGNGSFCRWRRKPDLAVDLAPEFVGAVKADWLSYPVKYEKGTLVIGNPPFGSRLSLAMKFYEKACLVADYIAFILPASQLGNEVSFNKFDLIESVDLGKADYSGRSLWCCFNVWRRPEHLKRVFSDGFRGVKIWRQDQPGYDSVADYDIRMCYYGSGTCGKVLSEGERYSGECKIKVDDAHPQKGLILDVLRNTDWKSKCRNIAMCRLKWYIVWEELRRRGVDEMSGGALF